MFISGTLTVGKNNDRRTGVVDARCTETERKARGKMLQDVPMIVFLRILNLIIWSMKIYVTVYKWIEFYTLENTFNSCYEVNSTVTFSEISVFSQNPLKQKMLFLCGMVSHPNARWCLCGFVKLVFVLKCFSTVMGHITPVRQRE
jgi:hypothetical protein